MKSSTNIGIKNKDNFIHQLPHFMPLLTLCEPIFQLEINLWHIYIYIYIYTCCNAYNKTI